MPYVDYVPEGEEIPFSTKDEFQDYMPEPKPVEHKEEPVKEEKPIKKGRTKK